MKLGRNVCLDEISDKFNPFPNKPWFSRICSKNLSKTLWEKEKLLVMSNFSFYHSVFYRFGELSAISLNLKLLSANSFSFFFGKELKMDHVGSKTRSVGHIIEKHCVCSRGHIFNLIIVKLGQNVFFYEISDKLKNGSCWVKN